MNYFYFIFLVCGGEGDGNVSRNYQTEGIKVELQEMITSDNYSS